VWHDRRRLHREQRQLKHVRRNLKTLRPPLPRPAARASKTVDAAGKLVTPGLIDLHCHVYPYGSAIGIPADELVQFQGTTTVVSAGDAGVNNLAALRRYIVAQSRVRIYAFVHIANNGLSGSRSPSSTTSTMRRSKRAPWRSPKTRIS